MMKARRTLAPGEPGTKNETAKYGKRLVFVRYRIDTESSRRYKTVELIEEEITLPLKIRPIPLNKIMKLRILPHEGHLRSLVKSVGGTWDMQNKVWLVPYGEIRSLGLESRIVLHKK